MKVKKFNELIVALIILIAKKINHIVIPNINLSLLSVFNRWRVSRKHIHG